MASSEQGKCAGIRTHWPSNNCGRLLLCARLLRSPAEYERVGQGALHIKQRLGVTNLPIARQARAWRAHLTVNILSGNLHLPYRLRGRSLSDLENCRIVLCKRCGGRFVVLHIAVLKNLCVAPEKLVVRRGRIEGQSCRHGCLDEVHDGNRASARWLSRYSAGSPGTTPTPRSSPLSKRTSENLPVVFVVVTEGPCWAKNQSVGLVFVDPSASNKVKSPWKPRCQRKSPVPAPLF